MLQKFQKIFEWNTDSHASKCFMFSGIIPVNHTLYILVVSLILIVGFATAVHSNTHLNETSDICATCINETQDRLYIIKSIESQVIFKLTSFAAFSVTGIANSVKGYISHNPSKPQNNRVSVMLDTNDISMSNPVYSRMLKGKNFLDVERYPQISFTSSKVEMAEDGSMNIHGKLTIRGNTRDEILNATLTQEDPEDDVIKFVAMTSIDRYEYGMNSLRFILSNKVEFIIEVIALPS